MEARTIFAAISMAILANGIVLAIIYRDLPQRLRPAAISWQMGTVFIALGCAVLSFTLDIYRPLQLTLVNGLLVYGTTCYLRALQHFYALPPKSWQNLPTLLTVVFIFLFSAVYPHFGIRLTAASAATVVVLWMCVDILHKAGAKDHSSSRRILIFLFSLVIAFGFIRYIYYASTRFGGEFIIEGNASWMNMVSPIVTTLLPITGTTAFVLMCADYLRQKFEQAASTDYLTRLPNRRALMERGQDMVQRASSAHKGLALAILDVDKFKTINDTYGHDIGDRALVQVAQCLKETLRPCDFAARSGGEEFVLLLEGMKQDTALERVRTILAHIQNRPFTVDEQTVPLTASAGIALHHATDESLNNMLRRADKALYAAKAAGRNRAEIRSGG
ncbi:diguanylate cyclase [Xanthobacter sp. TB0136]|uniref:diguanylate cyclase n=1 Tax=Xanthobacter sp. TB0136 TaxID=3459177 RepID=UPI00403A20AD